MTDLKNLRDEYSRFYDIRNHPTEKTEFENWRTLSHPKIEDWCGRLQEQAIIVRNLLNALKEHKSDRGYHEMKSYFHEDFRELQTDLRTRGFELT